MFPNDFFNQFKNKELIIIKHPDEIKEYSKKNVYILCCYDYNLDYIDNNIDIVCFDLSLYKGQKEMSYTEVVLFIKQLYIKGVKAVLLINKNEILYAYDKIITPQKNNGQSLIELANNLSNLLKDRGEIFA